MSGASAGRSAATRVYVAGVAAGAGVLVLGSLRSWGAPSLGAVLFFTALHALGESSAVGTTRWTASGGFLALMTAAFATTPSTAAAVGALSAFSLLELRERPGVLKIAFNAGQGLIYTGGASAAFWLVRSALGTGAGPQLIGALAAAATAFVLNTGLTAGVIAIDRRRRLLGVWREFIWALPTNAGFTFVALLVAVLHARSGSVAVLFLFTPIVVLRMAHKGYVELLESHRRTVEAFAWAVDFKDPYTRGHSERVAHIALALFRELGTDESLLEDLYSGALLHDVGKIGMSGRLLTKPGALTPEEIRSIRDHPVVGAEAARDIAFLASQVPMILFHHERMDGRGYPWGIAGEAIPFEARVLAVADTLDALTSDRPYRPRCPLDEAMREIHAASGTQLDPDVVAVLDRLHRDGALEELLRQRPAPVVAPEFLGAA